MSYRVRRLAKTRLPRAAGVRRLRRFGAASLSILGAPQIGAGDNGGNDCRITITNNLPWELEASSESKWPTDTWDEGIPFQYVLDQAQSITWGSDGGLFRGCSVSGGWTIVSDPDSPPNPPQGTFNLNTEWEWNGGGSTGHTCTNTNWAQLLLPGLEHRSGRQWRMGTQLLLPEYRPMTGRWGAGAHRV